MKLNKLALIVGAAVASVSGMAHAVHGNSHPLVHDASLNLSSASAIRDTFARMISAYCDQTVPNSRNLYEYLGNKNFRAYECQTKPGNDPVVGNELTAKGLAAKKILIRHTVEVNSELGGSIVGVMPIYHNIQMQFVTVDTNCTPMAADALLPSFARWNCPNTAWALPDAGASDTEPSSFQGVNVPTTITVVPGNASIANSTLVSLWKTSIPDSNKADNGDLVDFKAMFGAGFGVAATKAAITAGITNLSHDQVASILSGGVEDWSNIFGPAISGSVKVCRRTAGSGTQASFNAYFSNNPCGNSTATSLTIATKDDTGPVNGTLTVIESSTTSGVKTCLTTANTAGELAIGLISLENNEVAPGWEFISLDNNDVFDPSETNASPDGVGDRIKEDLIAKGTYGFYMEPTMQWRTNGTRAITGTKLALAQLVRDNAGNPEITKQLPGMLSLPSYWNIAPFSTARGTPTELSQGVNNYSRDGLSCKPSYYH